MSRSTIIWAGPTTIIARREILFRAGLTDYYASRADALRLTKARLPKEPLEKNSAERLAKPG